MLKRAIVRLVDGAGRHPFVVLALTAVLIAATWAYAQRLELRSDFIELLPRDSPGFIAYEHQLGRVSGAASFNFVIESPDRKANERFIDALAARLQQRIDEHRACTEKCADDRCRGRCGENLITYFEAGTKEVQGFFKARKWLFASLNDLEEADATVDRQIAIRSGLVENLDDDAPAPTVAPKGAPASASSTEKKSALGLDDYKKRWEDSSKKFDDFPTGYFAVDDGTLMVLRVLSRASGTGGESGDRFMAEMTRTVRELAPSSFHPAMKVGYAGDIPNAKEEKESIVSEAVWAFLVAALLTLGGIVVYFRSPWSLVVVFLPVLVGIGAAYAFATAVFGYVNTAGAFLGAIIVGNGINYPIVLFARYREFRARGMTADEARREAVLNAFRAELVGAAVAGIAYGSLTVTRFRGFSQFGAIGFFGMFFVWASIIPLVPALIVLIEAAQRRLPTWLRDPDPRIAADGTRGPFIRFAARVTERYAWPLVLAATALTVVAAARIPGFLRDPWEYNFHRLGSKETKRSGAGEWSNKADRVFKGKQDIGGVRLLADTAEQVAELKAQIRANDRKDPEGPLIEKIVTINDFLPGTIAEQKAKLAVLERLRERLSGRVLYDLEPDERTRVEELRPPEDLAPLVGKDLPQLIRRRFEENDGRIGTLLYMQYRSGVSQGDGRLALRIAKTTDNVVLPSGTLVRTASRATVYAEMVKAISRDAPLATLASFLAVVVVVIVATHSVRGAFGVLLALTMGVVLTVGSAAYLDHRLNFLNFIALPITFGIGCEYPFNIFDRSRLLLGDVTSAVKRSGGAVVLCSYTTIIGYGSLLVADQQAVESFGNLAVVGEFACISMAIFFLPSLLHLLRRRSDAQSRAS